MEGKGGTVSDQKEKEDKQPYLSPFTEPQEKKKEYKARRSR